MAVIALDLGGTKLAGAIINPSGRVVHRQVGLLAERRGKAVGALIREQVVALLAQADSRRIKVSAIGVAVPGIANISPGKVWAPNIPGWEKYPLHRELSKIAGERRVVIEGDRACYILGETWLGAARGCHNAIFLAVGTGIGAGILVDGRVLHGANDIAGAIGWLALDRPFRREYVQCGCFEYHASGDGLAKVAREMRRTAQKQSAQEIFTAAAAGDRTARAVVAQGIEFWGMAAANLVSLFNPEVIVFGGGVFGPAKQYLEQIRSEAARWAQPIAMKKVKLKSSTLDADAGLLGAAHAALQSS